MTTVINEELVKKNLQTITTVINEEMIKVEI